MDPLKSLPRFLGCHDKNAASTKKTFVTPWIVTYGAGYEEAKEKCRSLNCTLSLSETWRDEGLNVLQVVARKAPTLQDKLFRRKALALQPLNRIIQPCSELVGKRRGPKCLCCSMVGKTDHIVSNGVKVNCAGGNYKSNNIIYVVRCKLCKNHNCYVGKTVTELHTRLSQHRSHFNKLLKKQTNNANSINLLEIDDEQIVGVHLYFKHCKHNVSDFNRFYSVDILSHCSPSDIRRTEQLFINKLKTLTPYGLNQCNSIGD